MGGSGAGDVAEATGPRGCVHCVCRPPLPLRADLATATATTHPRALLFSLSSSLSPLSLFGVRGLGLLPLLARTRVCVCACVRAACLPALLLLRNKLA